MAMMKDVLIKVEEDNGWQYTDQGVMVDLEGNEIDEEQLNDAMVKAFNDMQAA